MPRNINPANFLMNRETNGKSQLKDRFFQDRLAAADNLHHKTLTGHSGIVNSMEFTRDGQLLISGADEKTILVWNVTKTIYDLSPPTRLETSYVFHVHFLTLNMDNSRIISAGCDCQMNIHDIVTGNLTDKIETASRILGLSAHGENDYLFSTVSENGELCIYDTRYGRDSPPLVFIKKRQSFNSVMYNPTNPNELATTHKRDGTELWDVRQPNRALFCYNISRKKKECIFAGFNYLGNLLLTVRRRTPPIIYNVKDRKVNYKFYHPSCNNWSKKCTPCFAGEYDEYFLIGSDVGKSIFMWDIPDVFIRKFVARPQLILSDNPNLIEHVRYNKHNKLIASAGTNTMIRLWSTFPFDNPDTLA